MGNTQIVRVANAMDEDVFVKYHHEREAVRCSSFLTESFFTSRIICNSSDSKSSSIWRWPDVESEFVKLEPKAVLSIRPTQPNQKVMFLSVIAQSGRLLLDSLQITWQQNVIISSYGQIILAQSHQVWVDKRGRNHLSSKTRRDSRGMVGEMSKKRKRRTSYIYL